MSRYTPFPTVLLILTALLAGPIAAAQPLTLNDHEIYEANKDAVVYLKVTGTDKNGVPTDREGTGFLVSSMGHLITAHHILQDDKGRRFDQVKIEGVPGSRFGYPIGVHIVQEEPRLDLILLKFMGNRTDYKTVRVCSEEGLKVADVVVALGFPTDSELAFLKGGLSHTAGPQGQYQTYTDFSPGFSGGPVFDQKGSVVGVVRGGRPGVAGINFFNPISYANNLLNLVSPRPACNDPNQPTTARDTNRPDNPDTYYAQGISYLQGGNNDRAITEFNNAIRLAPAEDGYYYHRGLAYYRMRQVDKAIADWNQAIKLNPKNAYAYRQRGNAFFDKKEYGLAIADYNQAIELEPEVAVAYYNRGLAYKIKGDKKKAIADFQRALKLPSDPGVKQNAKEHLEALKGNQQMAQ